MWCVHSGADECSCATIPWFKIRGTLELTKTLTAYPSAVFTFPSASSPASSRNASLACNKLDNSSSVYNHSGPDSYRIIFIPETIGSLVYLSQHLAELKKKVVAGFNISCVGDEERYSYVESHYGKSFADKVASNVLAFNYPGFIKYSFLDRGSDERQYCSPHIDLPLVALSRSKYGTYPEYHTSLDNLGFVTPRGLFGGYGLVKNCIDVIEKNKVYRVTCYGEPQLWKRGLCSNLSFINSIGLAKMKRDFIAYVTTRHFLAYADGDNDWMISATSSINLSGNLFQLQKNFWKQDSYRKSKQIT